MLYLMGHGLHQEDGPLSINPINKTGCITYEMKRT
jgi:hypothetical protein